MFDNEEKVLEGEKAMYKNISIPSKLDAYINKGIKRGKNHRRAIGRTKAIAMVACALLAFLITSIRISPAFASYLSRLPGVATIIELLHHDKGLEQAIENDLMQQVGISDIHDDLVFTIDKVIADNARIIMFYTLESKGNHGYVSFDEYGVLDENGNHLECVLGITEPSSNDMRVERKRSGRMDIDFIDEVALPEALNIEIKLKEAKERYEEFDGDWEDWQNPLDHTWKISFPLDKTRFENLKETYMINKTIEVEGQKITFEKATIYPTRMGIDIKYHDANTKKILGFDDLILVDEIGEVWGSISGGLQGHYHLDGDGETLYMESVYFSKPKKLYLKGSSIRTLDKDKLTMVIDIDRREILTAPDNQIALSAIDKVDDMLELVFKIENNSQIDSNYFALDSVFSDAEGNEYPTLGSSMTINSSGVGSIEYRVCISSEPIYKSPLMFTVRQYPVAIKKEFNVRIK